MRKRKLVLAAFPLLALLGSCQSVKPYQKAYLNEEEMKLSARKLESFETSFESYREGASGANGGKVGGGCGCN
ncbi:DUF4266 domain-containing protein [Pontibacter litorisediminis]|uniref:DUF4266 domain-containing protein n=1 Tax=Pontibacter litorisediminis TaxID=1846260 RepID=UPI0023EDAC68|nr:DUF4266 domain-containing protein [Pontibacter litorisediminis]